MNSPFELRDVPQAAVLQLGYCERNRDDVRWPAGSHVPSSDWLGLEVPRKQMSVGKSERALLLLPLDFPLKAELLAKALKFTRTPKIAQHYLYLYYLSLGLHLSFLALQIRYD